MAHGTRNQAMYEIFIAGPNDNAQGWHYYQFLPPGVASVQGLSRDKDSRFIDYETHDVLVEYDDEIDMRLGGKDVVQKWLEEFNDLLSACKPTAVEWRITPRYQHSNSIVDGKWKGWVHAQFSLHDPETPVAGEAN